MATAAQMAANLANAQHSTGPRSPEGKARSSQNNLRYGFRSQSVLLPGDDPAAYQQLLDELTAHFAPVDLTAQRFVREMADAEWRLRRVRLHQEVLLTARIELLAKDNPTHSPDLLQALAYEALHRETGFSKFLTYEAKFERQYDRAYQGWLRQQQKSAHPHPPCQVPTAKPVRTDEPNPSPKPAAPEPHAIPRSAPCPCGSGEKYKRCCGRHAPALIHNSAASPAPYSTLARRTRSAPLLLADRKNLPLLPRTI